MTQNVEHAPAWVKVGSLKSLAARLFTLSRVVLRKAAVHDAPVAVKLGGYVSGHERDCTSSNEDGEQPGT